MQKGWRQQRCRAIAQQKQVAFAHGEQPLPLLEQFYHHQLQLVRKVEGQLLQSSFPINACFAVLLSLGEFAIALWIVEQATALAEVPFLIRAIASSIPVVLTHAAAVAQAECAADIQHLHAEYGLSIRGWEQLAQSARNEYEQELNYWSQSSEEDEFDDVNEFDDVA